MRNTSTFLFYNILLYFCTCSARQGHTNVDDLLKKSGIRKTNFHLSAHHNGNLHVTNLDDNARDMVLFFKEVTTNSAVNEWQRLYRKQKSQGKTQKPRHLNEFPCNINGTRSAVPPTSVHRVRPGDIDVIAAIGDSLSAGVAILSDNVINLSAEFRSLAYTGGGAADWRTVLTLPNILKVFNPNLYGYAIVDVGVSDKRSNLNIAETMIMSPDMEFQIHVLIQRMQRDPRVDMENHWKLLTMFVGNNDICSDMCHYDDILDFLKRHEQYLRTALTILRDNVPRLLVNIISPPDLAKSLNEKDNISWFCEILQTVSCSCLRSFRYDNKYLQNVSHFIERFQRIDERLASLAEFQTEDFAVIYQPFTHNLKVPKISNGNVDLRYLAMDCFHFSQLGHAYVANLLWNNMMQPVGQKEWLQDNEKRKVFEKFECPTESRPYIATCGNSNSL